MFRRLIVAAALALPLAGFARAGAISPVAHAQTPTPIATNYCWSSYPEGPPYYMYCDPDGHAPGGDLGYGGTGPFHDPSGSGIHWTGSAGSYAHFGCYVPSIVDGDVYFTTTSSEMDFGINQATDTFSISEWCQVQTEDHPGTNLLAYLGYDSGCYSQGLGDYGLSNAFGNNFYVTENPTGVATLHCNFEEPLEALCRPGTFISPTVSHSSLDSFSAIKDAGFTPDAGVC